MLLVAVVMRASVLCLCVRLLVRLGRGGLLFHLLLPGEFPELLLGGLPFGQGHVRLTVACDEPPQSLMRFGPTRLPGRERLDRLLLVLYTFGCEWPIKPFVGVRLLHRPLDGDLELSASAKSWWRPAASLAERRSAGDRTGTRIP
jgi:hypothetical protein